MISHKQREANRNNAKLSTGPRTDEGKERSKFNAITHGMRTTQLLVLPYEDPDAYRARVDGFIDACNPTDACEDALVRRLADVSWKADRINRIENVHASKRVADAMDQARQEREDRFVDALRKLIPPEADVVLHGLDPVDATQLREDVEATAQGCRLLLSLWNELRDSVVAETPWHNDEELYVVRMLGGGPNLISNPAIIDVVLANRVARRPDLPHNPETWQDGKLKTVYNKMVLFDAFGRGPTNSSEAFAVMRKTADQAIARLERILADRERDGDAGEKAAELAGLMAAFDTSAEGERLRRYHLSLSREMRQTLDALRRYGREKAKLTKDTDDCSNAVGEAQGRADRARRGSPDPAETDDRRSPLVGQGADAPRSPSDARARRGSPDPAETDDRRSPENDASDDTNEPIVQVTFANDHDRAADSTEAAVPTETKWGNRKARKRREALARRAEKAQAGR